MSAAALSCSSDAGQEAPLTGPGATAANPIASADNGVIAQQSPAATEPTAPGQPPTATEPTAGGQPPGEAETSSPQLPDGNPAPLPPPETCDASSTRAVSGQRLTRSQYVSAMQDVLGISVGKDTRALLPPDVRVNGYSNTFAGQLVSFDLIEAYATAAASIAGSVQDLESLLAEFGCADIASATCEQDFVNGLGTRLYRRPLDAAEVTLLLPLFEVAADQGDLPTEGARLVLEAMLQSPKFLYRLEENANNGAVVDGYSIAARLSTLIWNSAPDESLLQAAERGELSDPAARRRIAEQMLATPEARRASRDWAADWLDLEVLETLTRDLSNYPSYSPQLAAQMKEATARLVEHVLWQQGQPPHALLSSPVAILTPELAELIGEPPRAAGWQEYDLSGNSNRRGILTQPGVLAVAGGGEIPSLVRRALFVLENVLCRGVPPPPPDIVQDGEISLGRGQRDASEERLMDGACMGCHGQFDQLAYAFETFDALGAARSEDERGNAVKSQGELTASLGGATYDTPAEYIESLAALPEVQQCMVRKIAQYSLGRALEGNDACYVSQLAASGSMATYRELLLAIVASENFHLSEANQ